MHLFHYTVMYILFLPFITVTFFRIHRVYLSIGGTSVMNFSCVAGLIVLHRKGRLYVLSL